MEYWVIYQGNGDWCRRGSNTRTTIVSWVDRTYKKNLFQLHDGGKPPSNHIEDTSKNSK